MALKSKQDTIKAEIVEDELPFPVPGVDEDDQEQVTDIVEVKSQSLPDTAILDPSIPMSTKIGVATNVANCLKDLVVSQGLVVTGLNPKQPEAEYVTVEGWEVLGTMLGIVPDTKIVEEMKNDKGRTIGFKARATLYQNPVIDDGKIVGGTVLSTAEAYCTRDDFQKKFFSMASMAQTRALGKAYRMALSWIVKMAGFEATYAEDMQGFRGK
jgi:hypothetical protein